MVTLTAEYAGGEITPQPGEIEDAQWYRVGKPPTLPVPFSIGLKLIEAVTGNGV